MYVTFVDGVRIPSQNYNLLLGTDQIKSDDRCVFRYTVYSDK